MNTQNNRKRKDSQTKIKKVFIKLLQEKELDKISVSEIVKEANINRSTFYSNYLDIYDLANKLKKEMYHNILSLYKEEANSHKHSYNFLILFKHIKENQEYYKTFFKLKFDFSNYYDLSLLNDEALKYYNSIQNIDYHIAFFEAGMSAIIRKWLFNGCIETPEEINEILRSEYNIKNLEN